jgi:hypothetical protein
VRRQGATFGAAWLQMAAGIVLFAFGTGFGALVLTPRASPDSAAGVALAPPAAPPGQARSVVEDRAGRAAGEDPGPAAATRLAAEPAASPPESATPAPGPQAPAPRSEAVRFAASAPDAPRTADDALAFMRRAETAYLEALTLYAEMAGGFEGGDPAARLAALEGIMLTTRAALGVAPADPIINGYHLTALAQRDATLRQIAASSSQSWF